MNDVFFKQLERLTDSDRNCKILVAISGGADSVVLSHLLHKAGYKIGLAHCNFKLRGDESDEDELFVRNFADEMHVPFYIKHFETKVFSKENKISIQMAARDLRYTWFQELATTSAYDFIALAHHLDDQIETFFINLFRGSGIRGLSGMPAKNGKIIRPLLATQRVEIEQYAVENHLKYRTDSSNAKSDYLRNNIRNKLLPEMYNMISGSKSGILHSLKYLSGNEILYNELVSNITKDLVHANDGLITISKEKILAIHSLETFLFECISPYGFKRQQIDSIANAMSDEAGKTFFSESHRLIINREVIEISPIKTNDYESQYLVNENDTEVLFPISLQFSIINAPNDFVIMKHSKIALLDYNLLHFPMHIRKWKAADRFVPFGMHGSKLVSDFFTDLHLTKHEKESSWLLCNNDDTIVWIIGYRISDNFKITGQTKQVLKIHKITSESQ